MSAGVKNLRFLTIIQLFKRRHNLLPCMFIVTEIKYMEEEYGLNPATTISLAEADETAFSP
ncbi:hypothetical protein [Zhongshania sp.]|jgi:hypothetical protein|uniref:hypothetical protein n=1 Tax=Zhongshania sp. TaxID=1971902 RepID=UPI0039E4F1FC